MADQVKSSVRMCQKGKEHGYIYEVPINVTENEKIQYVKDKYKAQMKK